MLKQIIIATIFLAMPLASAQNQAFSKLDQVHNSQQVSENMHHPVDEKEIVDASRSVATEHKTEAHECKK